MSSNSGIQWTDHTFNPWWGCEKVAQGCKFCYAEGVAERFYGREIWGPSHKTERKIASEKVWNDPMRWQKQAAREGRRFKVFCLSMGDCLEDHPQLVEPRKRLVGIIEATPNLDWQLLTKRPENHEMFRWGDDWPANVWFGASAANDNEWAIIEQQLRYVPARIVFASLEPLIGRIKPYWGDGGRFRIDWIIVGGESGRSARVCRIDWIIEIVKWCSDLRVPCFVKQFGSHPQFADGKDMFFNDAKGGDETEWLPEWGLVRQFPKSEPSNAPV
jgi:protein gp37